MKELPNNTIDTARSVSDYCLSAITDEPSIIFFVLGTSAEAKKLAELAEAQAGPTGVEGWVRRVIWLTDFEDVVLKNPFDTYLRPKGEDVKVDSSVIAFTVGFGDIVAMTFTKDSKISAFQVFMAYLAAESEDFLP